MKIYIFNYVSKLTSNYHEGGGLVVIAKDTEAAKALIATDDSIKLTGKEWTKVVCYDVQPDAKTEMFIFPDAGCC